MHNDTTRTPLTGKVALVTGASRGIGAAIAHTLTAQGIHVIGSATTASTANSLNDTLDMGIVLDIACPDSIQQAIEKIQTRWPTGVDILVNNAGITKDALLLRMKPEQWEKVIHTNLTGPQRMTQACLKSMLKKRWGRIIYITSVVAAQGNPGQTNYAASKSGLLGLMKSLSLEVASRHITVNAIAPGFIDTDMTRALTETQKTTILSHIPMGCWGKTEDIAHAVLFLLEAGYVTGQTLHVNGGLYR